MDCFLYKTMRMRFFGKKFTLLALAVCCYWVRYSIPGTMESHVVLDLRLQ